MDYLVLKTQKWINKTYYGKSGYAAITEDGATGWGTMGALIKALQIELGASVDGSFGPGTASKFSSLAVNYSNNENIVYILQGGLYCKGYDAGSFNGIFSDKTELAVKELQQDAGIANTGIVNSTLMKSILTMDSFKLLNYGEYHGDSNIRILQQSLNSRYSNNTSFEKKIGLVPCNGIYERTTNKALLMALQIEEDVSIIDGIWGTGTKNAAPTLSLGSTRKNFIYLLQYALYCNGFNPNGFDGGYGSGVKQAVADFQTFCGLYSDGIAGKQTWASLLVSTGDSSRKGTICDCSTTITQAKAQTLKNNGYKSVGRYLTGKFKTSSNELNIIFSAGLKVIPIFETGGYKLSYFNSKQGNIDAKLAIQATHDLGFYDQTIIYFTVDFDAVDDNVTSSILPYFNEIHNVFLRTQTTYKIGIYAPRNVCSRVSKAGYSCSSFVCDMSSGFSGNLGYPLPTDWAIDQISTITIGSGIGQIEIDNNISSNRDLGVSSINPNNNAAGIPDIAPIPGNENEVSARKILYNTLAEYRKEHLSILTKIKSDRTMDEAFNAVFDNDYRISDVSKILGVPKAIIQSIIFREQICIGLEDSLADELVKSGNRVDSSTGLGQIFAATAIDASNDIDRTTYDSKNISDLNYMWWTVQTDYANIYYIGLILKHWAKIFNINLNNASEEEIIQVLARYNGTGDKALQYGQQTILYYDAFIQYIDSINK